MFKSKLCQALGFENIKKKHILTKLYCLGFSSSEYKGRYFTLVCPRCGEIAIIEESYLKQTGEELIKRLMNEAINEYEKLKSR